VLALTLISNELTAEHSLYIVNEFNMLNCKIARSSSSVIYYDQNVEWFPCSSLLLFFQVSLFSDLPLYHNTEADCAWSAVAASQPARTL